MKNMLLPIVMFFLGLSTLAAQRNACPPPHCECVDGLSEMELYYFGTAGEAVDIEVSTGQSGSLPIASFSGVASGTQITISAAGLPNGRFTQHTDFRITNAVTGEACRVRIYSQCPSDVWPDSQNDLRVLGKKFGPLFVFGYTSAGNSQQCDLNDTEVFWRVGGNLTAEERGILGTLNPEALKFITDNQERARITPEGNVGIGLTMPEYKLDLGVTGEDPLGNGNGIRVTAATTDGGITLSNSTAGGQDYYIHSTGDGSENNAGNLAFGRAGQSPNMVLTPEGHVAIGSRFAPPSTSLYVVGPRVRFNSATSGRNLVFEPQHVLGTRIVSGGIGGNLVLESSAENHILLNQRGYSSGNVGVGLSLMAPQTKLHVQGDAIRLSHPIHPEHFLELRAITNDRMDLQTGEANMSIRSREGKHIWINHDESDGKVAIGTWFTPDVSGGDDISAYKLYVAGGILTEEIRVRTGWADHVFEKNYRLRTLAEVEKHIEDHGHLPDMPSAAEVESSGLPLGTNAVNQQVKIEEIFLHLIEMNKQIEELKNENAQLREQVSKSSDRKGK
jgi:hypothetical protein